MSEVQGVQEEAPLAPGDTHTETFVMLTDQGELSKGMWVVTQAFESQEEFFLAE